MARVGVACSGVRRVVVGGQCGGRHAEALMAGDGAQGWRAAAGGSWIGICAVGSSSASALYLAPILFIPVNSHRWAGYVAFLRDSMLVTRALCAILPRCAGMGRFAT